MSKARDEDKHGRVYKDLGLVLEVLEKGKGYCFEVGVARLVREFEAVVRDNDILALRYADLLEYC